MTPPPKGRKRSKTNFPAHIDKDKLPKGVYYAVKGDGIGYFRLATIDPDTGKRVFKRICDGKATLNQIWQLAERKEDQKELTFKILSDKFQQSLKWRKLSKLTQDDYRFCHNKICEIKTKSGVLFGDTPVKKWESSSLMNYQEKRGKDSPSRANKELAYIRRVLGWGKLYGYLKVNVAEGIEKLEVTPRRHYAEDKDFNFLMTVAKESGYWYMPYVFTLSYECALRLCEIVELTDARELPEGLKIIGRKGSNTNIIQWGTTLRSAWDEAKAIRNKIYAERNMALPFNPEDRFIFISDRTGDPLKERAIKTAKNRIDNLAKEKAAKLGIPFTPFTLHDIKKKSITDDKSVNKQKKSRHKTAAMVNLYDLSVNIAKPTTDD